MSEARLTVYFPAEAAARLAAVRRRSRMQTHVDVLTAALDCYLELVEVDRAGGAISVLHNTGAAIEVLPYSVDTEFEYPGFSREERDASTAETPRNFVFPKQAAEKIAQIRTLSRFKSSADVIRAALACFDELVQVRDAGDTILVRDRKGQCVRYSPFAPLAKDRLALDDECEEAEPAFGARTLRNRTKQNASTAALDVPALVVQT
jgi:hypothetical protein